MNKLYKLILQAYLIDKVFRQCFVKNPKNFKELNLAYSDEFNVKDFSRTIDNKILYHSKEIAGVAGLYSILIEKKYTIIYANDLSYKIHGIDAICFDKVNKEYIICEAKGTAQNNFTSYSSYLKMTKNKGYQLSWEWCWNSLVDISLSGPTAHVFLKILRPFLYGKVKRLLCVTHLSNKKKNYIIENTAAWNEDELNKNPKLNEIYDLSKQRKWFEEIISMPEYNAKLLRL